MNINENHKSEGINLVQPQTTIQPPISHALYQ